MPSKSSFFLYIWLADGKEMAIYAADYLLTFFLRPRISKSTPTPRITTQGAILSAEAVPFEMSFTDKRVVSTPIPLSIEPTMILGLLLRGLESSS